MKTILIVDDDPVSVRLIEMIVARNGYGTAGASSAAEALAILDTGQPIEMVITDQNLGGPSGLELSAKLRADVRFHNLPVILCTGVADRQTVVEAMGLGVHHFIVKPITPKVVMEKVNAVVAERPQIMEPRDAAMARLHLSGPEYKALLHTSQGHLARLGAELTQATEAGDRVTAVLTAGRLREPATMLAAPRLLAAIDMLEATRTWHDLEESVRLIAEEIAALESALEAESRPQLISRPLGLRGPD
jgi:two-component system, chemotaxis family, chemotaxis protein CheY